MYTPEYNDEVTRDHSTHLVVKRPHVSEDGSSEEQDTSLLKVLSHRQKEKIDCSTDGVLTPFCNSCLKFEPGRGRKGIDFFYIRTTCPKPKYLTENLIGEGVLGLTEKGV